MRKVLMAALLAGVALPGYASESWDDIRYQLYADRPLLDGSDLISIDAPYRTQNDARTQIAAFVTAPPGRKLGKVTLVLDENPMPVSAVFELDTPQPRFFFDVTMRVNGPTPLHVIAETTDNQIFVAEGHVKTSGLGACAAPPGTDPKEALATLGNMQIEVGARLPMGEGGLTTGGLRQQVMDLDIQHPSHSGMQMNQISLLYIPMRYVEDVDIDLDGAGYVGVTGSISLSENPRITMSVPPGSRTVDVTMTDTDGTVTHQHKKIAGF